ncbi:MAG: hypothetical protein RLZZ400_607, partial [Actinomycetota bacterium]
MVSASPYDWSVKLPDAQRVVLDLFDSHDVVLLGEEHGIANNLQFVCDLIPNLAGVGVHNIALEFSAEEFQGQSDELLAADVYNPQIARDMLFGYNVGWPYLEYQQVHEAAWLFNRTHDAKVRLIHPSYRYDWSKWLGDRSPENMRGVMHRGGYNEFRAARVSEVVLAGGKLLGLFGAVHAFSDSRNFEVFGLGKDFMSLGMLLKQKYGIAVASVKLNTGVPGYWDAELRTSSELRSCTIDREFLSGRDFSEVLGSWP